MQKLVYYFGDRQTEGKAEMRDLLGGKGANLAEMCNLGLPVPHGLQFLQKFALIIITTINHYLKNLN